MTASEAESAARNAAARTAATISAADLIDLHERLGAVRDLIETAPEWCESTPLGHLADMDWHAIGYAADAIHRLYLWRKHPSLHDGDDSYLPPLPPVPEPASLRVKP